MRSNTLSKFGSAFGMWLIALIVLAAMFLPLVAGAQPAAGPVIAWNSIPSKDPTRLREQLVVVRDVPTSGTTTVYTFPSPVPASGTVLTLDAAITWDEADARTLTVKYTEASGTGSRVVLLLTGPTLNGTIATEQLTMVTGGTYTFTGKVPWTSAPTITLVSNTGAAVNDTLKIDAWGYGLMADPQQAGDVISCDLRGTKESTSSVFSTNYIPGTGAWNPPATITSGGSGTALVAGDILKWLVRTSSQRSPGGTIAIKQSQS